MNKQIWVLVAIIIYYTFGQWNDYLFQTNSSEIYTNYIFFLERGAIPSINPRYDQLPLTHYLIMFFKFFFQSSNAFTISITRFLLYLGLALSYKKFLELRLKTSNVHPLIMLPLMAFVTDWNNSVLISGDEFRNLFANMAFLSFANCLYQKKLAHGLVWFMVGLFSHKIFIFMAFLIVIYENTKWIEKLIKSKFSYIFSPFLLALIIPISTNYFLKKTNLFGLGDKFNHKILIGLFDSFLYRPGVILVTIIYCIPIILTYISAFKLPPIINPKAKVLSFLCLTLFLISRIGILNFTFVEPNRIYFQMLPFWCLLLGMLVNCKSMNRNTIKLYFSFFFISQLLFRNFSGEKLMLDLNIFAKIDFLKIVLSQEKKAILIASLSLMTLKNNHRNNKLKYALDLTLSALMLSLGLPFQLMLLIFLKYQKKPLESFLAAIITGLLSYWFIFDKFFKRDFLIYPWDHHFYHYLDHNLIISASIFKTSLISFFVVILFWQKEVKFFISNLIYSFLLKNYRK